MILYHFTDEASAQSILKEGLTKGRINLGLRDDGKYSLILMRGAYQWLTDMRSLKKSNLIKSYRNVRLTVEIPDGDRNLLSPRLWRKMVLPHVEKGWKNCYTSPENDHYWVYAGMIPPEWIKREEA